MYFFAMFYTFLGISIAADKFMESIETITSRKKRLVIHGVAYEVLI